MGWAREGCAGVIQRAREQRARKNTSLPLLLHGVRNLLMRNSRAGVAARARVRRKRHF